MAESPRDTQTNPPATDKKQPPETVLLTAEELRAIAGGAGLGNSGGPQTDPQTTAKDRKKT
jgi:hypothetical protein